MYWLPGEQCKEKAGKLHNKENLTVLVPCVSLGCANHDDYYYAPCSQFHTYKVIVRVPVMTGVIQVSMHHKKTITEVFDKMQNTIFI